MYPFIVSGFNFIVTFCAVMLRASKVTSIEQSVECESVQEGGVNGYVHSLVAPAKSEKRLVIERGMCALGDLPRLQNLLGVRMPVPMTIHILSRSHIPLRTYMVDGCTVVRWKLSDLDAASGNALIETVEIVYETLKELLLDG